MTPTYALVPLLLTLVLAAVLVVGIWPRRAAPGALAFVAILIAISVWALATALALLSVRPEAAVWWTRVSYVGSAFEPAILLVLVLQYTGRIIRLPRKAVAALLIEPAVILALVFTDGFHNLVYRSWEVVRTAGISEVRPDHGPAFFVHNAYSYALVVLAVVMLGRFMFSSERAHRRQLVAAVLAILLPAGTNLLFSQGLWPWEGDPLPLASLAGGAVLAYALFGAAMFSVLPVARRAVIESLQDGVIVLDANGGVVDVNPAAAAMAGMPPAKLLTATETEVLTALRQRATESEGTLLGYQIDGQQRFVELERLDLRAGGGGSRGAALILRDVTGHVSAERASQDAMHELDHLVAERTAELARTGERLEATLRSLEEGVVVCDAGGYVALLNAAAERITGWLGPDAAGEPWHRIVPGAPHIPTPARWLSDGPLDIALDDSRVLYAAMTALITGPEAGGFIVLLSDVTEERASQRAGQQDAKLSALGRITAGIAHDFNNYLTGVLTLAQSLRKDASLGAATTQLLAQLEQASHDAAKLVSQILAFSQQPTGPREPLEMSSLIRDLYPLLRGGLRESVELSVDMAQGDYWVLANAGQAQQLITNLVSNAADAVEEQGHIALRLRELAFEDGDTPPAPGVGPGDWIELEIQDDGIGIDPAIMDRIFDPFFSTKPSPEAPGLGLSQVYGIARQYHGHVDVQSKLGKGTTVRVFLPASPARPLEGSTAAQDDIFGQGETVLLVEDDDLVSEVLKMALETLGYQVIYAPNGKEGLREYHASRDRISVVLTDLTMPVMGGIELVRELRSIDPHVRVVAMTGYAVAEDDGLRTEEGIAAWIEKPPELDELGATLRRTIRSERPGKARGDL